MQRDLRQWPSGLMMEPLWLLLESQKYSSFSAKQKLPCSTSKRSPLWSLPNIRITPMFSLSGLYCGAFRTYRHQQLSYQSGLQSNSRVLQYGSFKNRMLTFNCASEVPITGPSRIGTHCFWSKLYPQWWFRQEFCFLGYVLSSHAALIFRYPSNFYWRFIQDFSKITAPLTSMLKTSSSTDSSTSVTQIAVEYDRVDGGGGKLVKKSSNSLKNLKDLKNL